MADYAAASAAVPGRGEVLAKARKALSQPEPAAPVKTEADSFCDLHCADEHAPGCVLAADAEPVAWNPASKPLEFITECSDGTRFLNCAEMPAHAIRWSFAANPPRTALTQDRIVDLAASYQLDFGRWSFINVLELESFARAVIEAAHGITERKP